MTQLNIWTHRFAQFDGYGRFELALVHALLQRGDFDLRIGLAELLDLPGWAQALAGIDHSRLTLNVMPPWYLKPIPARQWLLSMYESTKIPAGWAKLVNERAERMIAPCEWVADVFKANGVTVPIHVVHAGTDVAECQVLPEHSANLRPYTFMALADRGSRKGWDTVYAAFCEAFRADDNVALVIKARSPEILEQFPPQAVRDPLSRKVRFWCAEIDSVRDVMAQADCVVYPACADGWGMFCREAAACGLPVLATNYSGTAVGCEHWATPLNDYRLVSSADLPTPQSPGQWARVSVQEVAHWMRYYYEHPHEGRQKGLESAAWIRANQTWAHTAQGLRDLIEDLDVHRLEQQQAQWAALSTEVPAPIFEELVIHKENGNVLNSIG